MVQGGSGRPTVQPGRRDTGSLPPFPFCSVTLTLSLPVSNWTHGVVWLLKLQTSHPYSGQAKGGKETWIGHGNLICFLLKAFQSPADVSLARAMLCDDFWLEKKTEKNFHYYFFNWVYWHPRLKKNQKDTKQNPGCHK